MPVLRRPVLRRVAPTVLLAVALTAASTVAATSPAVAATPVAAVQVVLLDPLMTDPVQLEVVATDADGDAVAFDGVVTLTTGRTSVSAAIASDGDGEALASLPTGTLSGGPASVRAVVRGGGRTVVDTEPRFIQIDPSLVVAGFGCAALTRSGGPVRFAVTTLNGEDVPHPAARETYHLPYVLVPNGPTRMVDSDGLPLATSGRLVLTMGAKRVATVTVATAVRALVFAVRWNGRMTGGFRPGVLTATLTLTDAHGRSVVATRTVHLVRAGVLPCH